jgi:hypothetical protein
MKTFLLLAAAPALIGAAQPVRLQPAGHWELDYSEHSCRLTRTFGQPERSTSLVMEGVAPDDPLSMVIVSNALKKSLTSRNVAAHFLPAGELVYRDGLAATTAGPGQPAAMWPKVSFLPAPDKAAAWKERHSVDRREPRDLVKVRQEFADQAAHASKTRAIRIDAGSETLLVLETGSLGKAFTMMRECQRDLVRSWGLDPDVQDRISIPATRHTRGDWLLPSDYPGSALARGEESVVRARLIVDQQGGISNCTSLSHFQAPDFERVVCSALMKRGKFYPAELEDGTKVPSYYTFNVRFQMGR